MKNKTKPINILSCSIDNKKVIWLPDINKYILVISPIEKIIKQLYQNKTDKSVLEFCKHKLGFTNDEAIQTISNVKKNLDELLNAKKNEVLEQDQDWEDYIETNFDCKRYYSINGLVFFVEYETAEIEYLIHPRFAHLETTVKPGFNHHFQLFKIKTKFALTVNKKLSGTWKTNMQHFMTGKFSMELLQKIYKMEEDKWMGVFHAAGISNGNECIIFLGDSGNGKSTLSAILMANGYDVLSDDFLPVESKTALVCFFPSAISVKKQAIDLLVTKFPELKHAQEYCYPAYDKTVRYLTNPLTEERIPAKVPCKALVFLKYEPDVEIQFKNYPKDIAFQKLIPDSWISPLETNAKYFLDWFSKLPCYQLTYSDNDEMVKTVKKLFGNDL